MLERFLSLGHADLIVTILLMSIVAGAMLGYIAVMFHRQLKRIADATNGYPENPAASPEKDLYG